MLPTAGGSIGGGGGNSLKGGNASAEGGEQGRNSGHNFNFGAKPGSGASIQVDGKTLVIVGAVGLGLYLIYRR